MKEEEKKIVGSLESGDSANINQKQQPNSLGSVMTFQPVTG